MSTSFLGIDLGDITGSKAAAKGAENASNAQVAALEQANKLSKEMYDTSRQDLSPWRTVGSDAVTRAGNMLTPGGFDFRAFQETPQYQFGFDQGMNGLQRHMASAGLTGSGAALKAATRYGQGYAGQQFGDYYNRLLQLSGMGQSAAGMTGQAGQNYAAQAGNNLVDMGNARGSAYIARGNVGVNNFNSLMQLGKMAASVAGAA